MGAHSKEFLEIREGEEITSPPIYPQEEEQPPSSDVDLLTERVKAAGSYLIER